MSSFSRIEDTAAKLLPKLFIATKVEEDGKKRAIGKPLFLQGLVSLSDLSAHYLSKHRGYLSLSGLTSLSDRSAKMLSRQRGTLHLDGLLNLTEISASWLSKHKGYLGLSGLTALSEEMASKFSEYQGELNLNGLTELPDSIAKALVMHRCFQIEKITRFKLDIQHLLDRATHDEARLVLPSIFNMKIVNIEIPKPRSLHTKTTA